MNAGQMVPTSLILGKSTCTPGTHIAAVCVHACMQASTHACTNAHVPMCAPITHADMHARTHACMRARLGPEAAAGTQGWPAAATRRGSPFIRAAHAPAATPAYGGAARPDPHRGPRGSSATRAAPAPQTCWPAPWLPAAAAASWWMATLASWTSWWSFRKRCGPGSCMQQQQQQRPGACPGRTRAGPCRGRRACSSSSSSSSLHSTAGTHNSSSSRHGAAVLAAACPP